MDGTVSESQLPGYATRWKGLVFIGISLIVISLDNTILNTAIPSISRQLSATTNELQWIVDGYVLIFASLLLTTGSIGDRYGRKKALQFGLVWFALGSLAAALSTSTGMLIATRAILGIGGALILPATLSIISATFPPRERAQAIAIWAAIFGLGVGIGPLLGGFLLEHFEWNSVFFVNLPVCIIALIGVSLYVGDSKDAKPPAIDIPGVLLSIAGLFALVYGIIDAGVHGWTDSTVLISFGVAVVCLTAFGWWEAHSPNAMLPMRFFKNLSFSGASIALSFVAFSQFGSTFFFSQYFQTIQGYSTFQAGLLLLPLAITLTAVATLSAGVAARIGIKYTVALGIGIAAFGLLFIAFTYKSDTSFILAILGQIILATGLGITFSPATNSIMSSVPISKAGVGSAMNDTTRQLGGALGIAALGTVMNISYVSGINVLRTTLPQLPAGAMDSIANSVQAAHIFAATLPDQMRQVIISTADQAYITGMSHAFFVGAIVMGLAALFVLAFLPTQVRRSQEEPTPSRKEQSLSVSAGD